MTSIKGLKLMMICAALAKLLIWPGPPARGLVPSAIRSLTHPRKCGRRFAYCSCRIFAVPGAVAADRLRPFLACVGRADEVSAAQPSFSAMSNAPSRQRGGVMSAYAPWANPTMLESTERVMAVDRWSNCSVAGVFASAAVVALKWSARNRKGQREFAEAEAWLRRGKYAMPGI